MRRMGDALWERIGREPSGNPFNSLVQLENEQGKPRNPFINAGAIAVADRLVSQGDAKAELLALMTSLCGEPIGFDEEVAASEAATGFRNYRARQLHEELRQARQRRRAPCWTCTSTSARCA